jgi:hypothetical protein
MKLLLAAALVSLATMSPAAEDAPSDHWDARITSVSGAVVVHPADGSADVDAKPDMPLEEGDRVVTLAGATAEFSLDGASLIVLRENSDFKLEKTAKNDSMFALTFGSLLAKIQKLGAQRLRVRTNSSVAAVRGTEFGVDARDEESLVGVFDEGLVQVTNDYGRQDLTPNQETRIARGKAPRKPAPLNRFAGRRAEMKAAISRLAAVKAGWKRLSKLERGASRAKYLRNRRDQSEKRSNNREEREEREEREKRSSKP